MTQGNTKPSLGPYIYICTIKKSKKRYQNKIQIMKKIVFFALLGLLGLQIQAQTTDSTDCPLITAHPWFVNFETDFDCWHQIPEGGWQNNIMSSDNEHMGITGSTNNMIVSPAVVIPSDTTGLRLYWNSQERVYGGYTNYTVLVSRSNWENLSSYDTIGYFYTWDNNFLEQNSVSLANYAGDTVYIAFKIPNWGHVFISDVAMYNSLAPIGTLETPFCSVATGDTTFYTVHLTQADDSLLTFSCHSTLLDTTFVTTDSTLSIVYPLPGSDTLTVTASNAYGALSWGKIMTVAYGTLPMVDIAGQAETVTDRPTLFTASISCGMGISYSWHSSGGASFVTNSVGDSAWVTYGASQANTEDTIRVIATNAFGSDTAHYIIYVRDCTPIYTLPWIETFADGDNCWYKPAGSKWYDAIPYPGNPAELEYLRHLYLNARHDTLGSWIISKEIQLPADTNLHPHLFWNVATSDENYHHLYSVLMTSSADFTDTANFMELYVDSATHINFSNYDCLAVDLTPFAGQNIHVAFHNYPWHMPSSDKGLYIDNVTIRTTCNPVIKNIAVATDIYTPDSGKCAVAILEEGNRNGMVYTWHSSLLDTTFVTTNDTLLLPYTFEGTDTLILIATNTYGTDTAYAVTQVHHCPDAAQIPFFESFETDSTMDCWRRWLLYTEANSSGGWRRSTRDGHSVMSSYDRNSWLISPKIQVPSDADGLTLKMKVFSYANYRNDAYLSILVSPTNSPHPSEFTDTIHTSSYVHVWENISIPLSAYAGQQIYIAFLHNILSTYPYEILIDSLSIDYTYLPMASIHYNDAFVDDTTTYSLATGYCVSDSLSIVWHSTLLDSTRVITGTNGLNEYIEVVYPTGGIDTITLIVSNVYGSDTDTAVVAVETHPLPQVSLLAPSVVSMPEVATYNVTLNDCSRNGFSAAFHSSLLDTTISLYNSLTLTFDYFFAGIDTITVFVSNNYGADTTVAIVRIIDCNPRAVPYTEDFEGVTATASSVAGYLPDCWTYNWNGNNAACAPHVITPTSYFISPNQPLFMVAGDVTGYANMAEVTLPRFSDDLWSLSMAFDYRFEHAYNGSFQVGYYNNNSFTLVQTITPHANNYLRDTVNFATATVPDAQIVLRWNFNGAHLFAIAIDNIEVFHDNTYLTPVGLTVDSINATTAHVSWNQVHATAYHLVISTDTNDMEYLVTDTTSLLVGLSHSTWYTVSVAGISDGDTGNYTTVQFHTLCAAEDLPYHEDFEAPTVEGIPLCWSASWNGLAARKPRVINTNDYTNISNIPDHAFLLSAGYGNSAEVTLPQMGDNLQNLSVAFDYRYENAYRGILQLGYYENDSVFITVQNMPSHANSYRRDTVSFAVASVPEADIVLRWLLGASLYSAVAIDNIEVFRHVIYYDVTLTVNDETMGIAAGSGTYAEGDIVTITAIPNEGFHFMYWNDGDTNAVRQISVTGDTLFTAIFAVDTIWRTVAVTAEDIGSVDILPAITYGSGVYADNSMVEIGYHMLDTMAQGGHWEFLTWSDGGSGNPRNIFVTSDTAIVALFEWVGDSTEAINELSFFNSQLSIYPNPARTNITFSIVPFNSIAAISILDMNGRIVYESRQNSGVPTCQHIDVSTLSPGTYFLRIITPDGTFVRKLVIQ